MKLKTSVSVGMLILSLTHAAYCAQSVGVPITILDASQTVVMEHQDRTARLKRLADSDLIAKPQFFEYSISAENHGVAEFPVEIPVLRVVFDDRVFFDSGHSELRSEAEAVIAVVAQSMKGEPPDVALFIAGHTDSTGDDDFNYNLGLMRAQAVAQALLERGLGASQLYRVSFGEKVPVASNETETTRSLNRRVEFVFSARAEAVSAWLAQQHIDPCVAANEVDLAKCTKRLVFVIEQVKPALHAPQLEPAEREHHYPPHTVPSRVTQVEQRAIQVPVPEKRIKIDLTKRKFSLEEIQPRRYRK